MNNQNWDTFKQYLKDKLEQQSLDTTSWGNYIKGVDYEVH